MNQNNATGAFDKIQKLIDNGNLQAAEDMIRQFQNNSDTAEWIFLRGLLFWKQSWYDDALSKVQQAVAMEPGNRRYAEALEQMLHTGQEYQNKTAAGKETGSCCDVSSCDCCSSFSDCHGCHGCHGCPDCCHCDSCDCCDSCNCCDSCDCCDC